MDNVIVPYTLQTDSSEESDDSDSSDEGNLLTNNIGVLNNKFDTKDKSFKKKKKVEDYQRARNKLFTPEIYKSVITIETSGVTQKIMSLEDDCKISTKNIIGFKILRSSFLNNGTTLSHFELRIPEIPDIACDSNDVGDNIITRIPLRQDTTNYHTHQYLELSLIDRYFYPINLNTLTINLSVALTGFFVFEITYLNEKCS